MDTAARRFAASYALAQLKLKYRFTLLGVLWNFLEPALFLGVLSVVFSFINRMNLSDYAVYLFSALVPWRYFEKAVNTGMDSIVGADWLLKKMDVTPVVFPVSRWIVASVECAVSLVVVFAIYAWIKPEWTVHVWIVPLAILPWAAAGLGGGMISAVLFAFFRDLRPIVQMFLMLAFFSAPILFRADLFPDGSIQSVFVAYHPLTYFAALFQKPLYFGVWPDVLDWVVSGAVSLAALSAGYWLMMRHRGRFYFYL